MSDKHKPPAIFITGIDTGVGKTLFTAALARNLANRGLQVGVMKPLETGLKETSSIGEDAALLQWAASSEDNEELISPCRLELAASPHQAAKDSGSQIDVDTIIRAFQKLQKGKDIVLVEGAGGLMVPIVGGYLMADLVRDLSLPLLIITHPELGTLNHTLLTTFAARTMELPVTGLVINRMPQKPDKIATEAPHLLSSLASADLLGVLPVVEGNDKEKVIQISDAIGKMPTYQWLLKKIEIQ